MLSGNVAIRSIEIKQACDGLSANFLKEVFSGVFDTILRFVFEGKFSPVCTIPRFQATVPTDMNIILTELLL